MSSLSLDTVNQLAALGMLERIDLDWVSLGCQPGGKEKNRPPKLHSTFSRRVDASLLEKIPPLLPLNLESSGSSG